MLRPYTIPAWKAAPFIRLLVPFIGGIMLQWYVGFSLAIIIIAIICFTIAYLLFRFFPLRHEPAHRLNNGGELAKRVGRLA